MTLLILTLWSVGIVLLIAVAVYRGRKPAKLVATNDQASDAAEAAIKAAAAADINSILDADKAAELLRRVNADVEETISRDDSGKYMVVRTPNLRFRGLLIKRMGVLRESGTTEDKSSIAPFGSIRKHAPHNR
ncbi:hypothetical protein [Pseudomonas fluorescens]|uniref:hypothetical protein n=1 Tax=Pseudomonas fluorescens TaxID=294 RepID=UPI00124140B1|nr:hypothetical protein [Pseudomonas fluorescens]